MFDGSEYLKLVYLAIMVTRGQAHADAMFKDFAFVFLFVEVVENNTAKVLIIPRCPDV